MTKRIESWVYVVINPLIEQLNLERHFLLKKNLTWRYHTQKAEYISPIKEYIDFKYFNIYDHYARAFPCYEKKFAEHDKLLKKAEADAIELFKVISKSTDFIEFVKQKLKTYSRDSIDIEYIQRMEEDKLYSIIIERTINELKEIPDHYQDYEFWNTFQHDFYEEISKITENAFQKLSNSKDELLHCSEGLVENLKEQSYKLCEENDIPADPFEREGRNRYREYSN